MYALRENIALEILRGPTNLVTSKEEARVLIGMLESVIGNHYSVSAPEVNIKSAAAIIRTPSFKIDLINPIIVKKEEPIVSLGESCVSFPDKRFNCLRYNKIEVTYGINKNTKQVTLEGHEAILAQHEIDHLNGVVFHDRKIRVAIVNDNGIVKGSDPCPCGSVKRFEECCSVS